MIIWWRRRVWFRSDSGQCTFRHCDYSSRYARKTRGVICRSQFIGFNRYSVERIWSGSNRQSGGSKSRKRWAYKSIRSEGMDLERVMNLQSFDKMSFSLLLSLSLIARIWSVSIYKWSSANQFSNLTEANRIMSKRILLNIRVLESCDSWNFRFLVKIIKIWYSKVDC